MIRENGHLTIELVGDLAGRLNLAANSKQPVTRDRDGLQVTLVAGAPTTYTEAPYTCR